MGRDVGNLRDWHVFSIDLEQQLNEAQEVCGHIIKCLYLVHRETTLFVKVFDKKSGSNRVMKSSQEIAAALQAHPVRCFSAQLVSLNQAYKLCGTSIPIFETEFNSTVRGFLVVPLVT